MRLKGIAIAAIAALTLVGCTSKGDAPVKEGTPAEQLAAARANLEKSPAVSFTLESTGLPSKAVGVSAAKGTGLFTPPSFKGTLNATVAGLTGTVDVIAVEQDVFMKFFTPGYNKIDPATYGAPNPARLFDKATGITSLIAKTQSLAKGDTVRDGGDVLASFTGTLPGAAVADLLVIGDRTATFDVTYGVTQGGHELRTVVLKGPFYPGATSTYSLRLKSLPQPVAITRP
ncbi:lipoprotein LprG [Phycicoccus badiiscoriae]|uniref:Lipoprotein LprG n=1 Tax=Pedococcus badiiscoriae TaxID=642776 RepID=A0A852WLF3_9MICO|nr:LppX_LprAFG lipoprotein [Pedococcus badiiscoriae]NYG07035.1 lipoprotein LprG [Pedococcus badiiscoriae]